METFSPHADLDPFVECYWAWQASPAGGELDPLLPDAAPELIFHLATPPSALRQTGQWEPQPSAFLLCATLHSVRLSIEKPMAVFAIRFRPWGISRFTARSMAELVDREIAPEHVFASFGAELTDAIRSATDTAERIAIADSALKNALAEHAEKDELLRRLHRSAAGGYAKGRDIAASLGISERSLRRYWRDIVGMEQRKFVSLMRFHRALAMIDAGAPLSVVAAECGYADQPHLARDIKSISGLPASYLRKRLGTEIYQDMYANRPSAPWTGN